MTKYADYTLIIPTVSTGNVPQLTADLFLHNIPFKLAQVLDSTFLYPFASPTDYTSATKPKPNVHTEASTGLELHVSDDKKLALLVQRAPVIPQYSRNFVDSLRQLASPFQSVVLLDSHQATVGSSDPSQRVHIHRDLVSKAVEDLTLNKPDAEEDDDYTGFNSKLSEFADEVVQFLGHGSLIVASIDVYEGDNSYDAQVLAQEAAKVIGLEKVQFNLTPKSWEGVYGDRPVPLGVEGGLFS